MVQKNVDYVFVKMLFGDQLLKKSKSFEWQIYFYCFFFNDNKLSSNMAQKREHIHYTKYIYKNHSFDKFSKMIFSLGIMKCENNNNNSFSKIYCLQDSVLKSTFDTSENY